MSAPSEYVLGSDPAEIARIDAQAAFLGPPTAQLLRAAGISRGMRVLDLGTGLGHVARLVAELVGSEGEVVGVDQDEAMLRIAEERRAAAGVENVRFVRADVRTFRDGAQFDAVTGRLVLFHLPEPVTALRHHAESLVPGGLMVPVDFDIGSARAFPAAELTTTALRWIMDAFRSADADPTIGAKLAPLLREAGFADVGTFGIQPYIAADDPTGPGLLAGVVKALAPQIVAAGIATEAELGLETIQERIATELRGNGAVLLPPTLVAAWGRRT